MRNVMTMILVMEVSYPKRAPLELPLLRWQQALGQRMQHIVWFECSPHCFRLSGGQFRKMRWHHEKNHR